MIMSTTTVPAKTNGTTPGETKPARREPADFFEAFQDEMARFFRPFGFGRMAMREPLMQGMQMPQTDVFEQDGNLVVSAELPGVPKEDISITLQQGDLIIQGEHQAAEETKEKDYYPMERRYGGYYRRIPLPFEAAPEQIKAKYTDGVLEVRIPKPAEPPATTTKIAVE
jgi:HSP20 family protein